MRRKRLGLKNLAEREGFYLPSFLRVMTPNNLGIICPVLRVVKRKSS
jgi:hypothetical protein